MAQVQERCHISRKDPIDIKNKRRSQNIQHEQKYNTIYFSSSPNSYLCRNTKP